MLLGAANDMEWVNGHPEAERSGLLEGTTPFDPASTPAHPDMGHLAEVLRSLPGVHVTDNPEGRFGALGGRAHDLVSNAPWDDYYGPRSPLERLCILKGRILRIDADPDTVTLIHYAEYRADLKDKKRWTHHYLVKGMRGPEIRTITCLDNDNGVVEGLEQDYFAEILKAYISAGRGIRGKAGKADCDLLDAEDLVGFSVSWLERYFA
jgi:aminoglycoside N3'-acetyltransferase